MSNSYVGTAGRREDSRRKSTQMSHRNARVGYKGAVKLHRSRFPGPSSLVIVGSKYTLSLGRTDEEKQTPKHILTEFLNLKVF